MGRGRPAKKAAPAAAAAPKEENNKAVSLINLSKQTLSHKMFMLYLE